MCLALKICIMCTDLRMNSPYIFICAQEDDNLDGEPLIHRADDASGTDIDGIPSEAQ